MKKIIVANTLPLLLIGAISAAKWIGKNAAKIVEKSFIKTVIRMRMTLEGGL